MMSHVGIIRNKKSMIEAIGRIHNKPANPALTQKKCLAARSTYLRHRIALTIVRCRCSRKKVVEDTSEAAINTLPEGQVYRSMITQNTISQVANYAIE